MPFFYLYWLFPLALSVSRTMSVDINNLLCLPFGLSTTEWSAGWIIISISLAYDASVSACTCIFSSVSIYFSRQSAHHSGRISWSKQEIKMLTSILISNSTMIIIWVILSTYSILSLRGYTMPTDVAVWLFLLALPSGVLINSLVIGTPPGINKYIRKRLFRARLE